MVIWGLDARKHDRGDGEIDAVRSESPMGLPLVLASRLTELQRQATDPPTANVLVKAYKLPDKPDEGFVVCFVPEGHFKPYRAEHADKQWYIRAGDNFVVMTPSMLRAMFYPRSKPYFTVNALLKYQLSGRLELRTLEAAMVLECTLANAGTATAKKLAIRVLKCNGNRTGMRTSRECVGSAGGSVLTHRPLHPGDEVGNFSVVWHADVWSDHDGWKLVEPRQSVTIAIYCDDQQPQLIEVISEVGTSLTEQERSLPVKIRSEAPET